MADFRKWFLAFAVLALFTSIASAQIQQQFVCGTNNAGVPPTVRAEGLTELVGDLVLNCTGGTPTLPTSAVPQANITIFLSTTVTSRLLDANATAEALLLVDEPHSPSNPSTPLLLCNATGLGGTSCSVPGSPLGNGVGTYNGSAGRYNVFEGRLTGSNQITFFGVPMDPPGTSGTRVFRITNVRGDASRLGVSSTLVPTQVTMYVSITASTSIPVNNPQQTVAYVAPGLVTSTGTATFTQCNDRNKNTAGDSSKAFTFTAPDFSFKFTEGFGSAWKVRNISEVITSGTSTASTYWAQGADANQNVPGAIYNTEAGFQNSSTSPGDPNPNPPGYTGTVLTTVNDGTWSSAIGSATQGTRLMLTFNSVPNGAQVWVPTTVALANPLGGSLYVPGIAVLTATDATGAGAFSSVSSPNSSGYAPVSVSSNTGVAVYEIVKSDPFAIETMSVGVEVVYASNVANNLPAPGVQSSITGSFAPLSTVNTASTSAPIPRFVPGQTPRNTFIINRCSCNILFPFVTNQQGFDTGVAIANTSVDPFGTGPQTGTVTLNYYSGGTPPPAQTTNAPVPGGQILTFTLSGGGNFGVAATPGFQGYIIAQAAFQYCHAFAYISAQGALPTAAGASEGYLGIVLDYSGLNRTGQIGEVQAH